MIRIALSRVAYPPEPTVGPDGCVARSSTTPPTPRRPGRPPRASETGSGTIGNDAQPPTAANIGSRPVKRNDAEGLKFEDLRAIPFVGSWAMMKQNIPGFYGVGSAIKKLEEKGEGQKLKQLYRSSLFFRTLVGNSMMSLTKTYYNATTYLAHDPEFGEFWEKMFAEYSLSKEKLLDISGLQGLMENNPNIRDSVRLRERIVLPLIAIQQFALMNIRNLTDENKAHEVRYRKLIIRTMFGIINAARNSA